MERVFGPDGRTWAVTRRPTPSWWRALLRQGSWVVEAVTEDETRRWAASSRWAAGRLVHVVAFTLRTGAESPPGELPPEPRGRDADGPSDQEPDADVS